MQHQKQTPFAGHVFPSQPKSIHGIMQSIKPSMVSCSQSPIKARLNKMYPRPPILQQTPLGKYKQTKG